MKYILKYKFSSFLFLLWFISCGAPDQTSVVILSCVDTEGNEIREAITITIDGQAKTCLPGDPLTFNVEMSVDQGYVSIITSDKNYRLASPSTYEIERSKGIELVLMFEADTTEELVVIPDFPDPEEPIQGDTDPQNVGVRFEVLPRQADVLVRSRSNNFEKGFNGSASVDLPEGPYEWQADMDGYLSSSDNFTVRAEGDNLVRIQLEEEELEPGLLSLVFTPRNASVNLRNRDTGDEFTFNSAGARDVELPPGLYDYRVTAPGYITEESNFRIREAGESELFVSLSSAGALELISRAEEVTTINQAQQLFQIIEQNGIPQANSQTRDRLFESLSEVAMILYDEGAQLNAINLFRTMHRENTSDVRVRLQLGTILILSGEYAEGRDMVRPVYGQLLNTIPRSSREEIAFQARYRNAQSYYLQFRSLPPDDYDARQSIGLTAISELTDVVLRFERSSDTLQDYLGEAINAEDWELAVRNELGY